MQRLFWTTGVWLLLLVDAAELDAAAPPRPIWPLDAAIRQRLDRLALCQPLEGSKKETVNVVGTIPTWLLTHLELPAGEERKRSLKVHADRLRHERTVPTPAIAQRVLKRLAGELPPHLAEFRYSLTVFDRDDLLADTPGGGYLHISRSLLQTTLADKKRGESALAFLLAREIGHVALQHCRGGWQRLVLEEELSKGQLARLELTGWPGALETQLHVGGIALSFLYSRNQEYEADLFALHLCRNARFDIDECLDGLRLLAVLRHPEAISRNDFKLEQSGKCPAVLAYYLSRAADPLVRLRRLLMERDGLVDPAGDFGLFRLDRANRRLVRCRPGDIDRDDKPIVFVHGLYGSKKSFQVFLDDFGKRKELLGRPLLVFRHPGNASLARCGKYLFNQVRRLVPAPGRATFICHSAGGLVFRYYAERLGGAFEQAVLLAVPNGGSNLSELKFLVDVLEFAGGLRWGLDGAIVKAVAEGRGEIGQDLHPDSLFLRYLGRDAQRAARYHVVYGEWLGSPGALLLQAAMAGLRRSAEERLLERLPEGLLREQARKMLRRLHLPAEILRGDLVVSSKSAQLAGAGQTTRVRSRHLAIRADETVIRLVLESIVGD